MSFGEFLLWLSTSAAWGAVSSICLTVIKLIWPGVEDKLAVILSFLLAALASVAAILIQPYLGQFPSWWNTLWPIIVWVAGQIWYELTKPEES